MAQLRHNVHGRGRRPNEARAIKRSRYALLKNPWNLTPSQNQKLAEVQKNNQPLYRAYLLKETLADALDRPTVKDAAHALDEWISWAARSRLEPFKRTSRTIKKHRDRILAYVQFKLTYAHLSPDVKNEYVNLLDENHRVVQHMNSTSKGDSKNELEHDNVVSLLGAGD